MPPAELPPDGVLRRVPVGVDTNLDLFVFLPGPPSSEPVDMSLSLLARDIGLEPGRLPGLELERLPGRLAEATVNLLLGRDLVPDSLSAPKL